MAERREAERPLSGAGGVRVSGEGRKVSCGCSAPLRCTSRSVGCPATLRDVMAVYDLTEHGEQTLVRRQWLNTYQLRLAVVVMASLASSSTIS